MESNAITYDDRRCRCGIFFIKNKKNGLNNKLKPFHIVTK